MEEMERLRELKRQGFYCSQIIVLMGLELQGKTNPQLTAAMQGLAGGLGFTGELCGALSGGAALLGLYAGKGGPEQPEDPRLLFMIEDLTRWFKEEYGKPFGGIRCEEIIGPDSVYLTQRCPVMTMGVFEKCKQLLVENEFDLYGLDND